ncbi:hypothetical protein [Clostridium beijerinckii]|nr:hypothetical protein [Clostridium beijerinckii]NRZ21002.1 hypothetical protein [Clostridium beijerinckii]
MGLVEGLWVWLKSSVINNEFFNSITQVRNAAEKFIRNINIIPTRTIGRLCIKM